MDLETKLRRAGLSLDDLRDPAGAFAALHHALGEEATVIDRYELEALHHGVTLAKVDVATRLDLGQEVLAVRGYDLVGPPSGAPVTVAPYDPAWPQVQDRLAYTDMKGAFIREALAEAEEWARAEGWTPS